MPPTRPEDKPLPRITELYAYVIADRSPDDEGVPAMNVGGGALPLMGADLGRATSLRKYAQEIADHFGKPVRLLRSTGLEEIDVVEPRGPVDAPQWSAHTATRGHDV